MQTSTPLVSSSGSLRRSVLLRDASNSGGSNRKRLSNIINQSSIVLEEADDELERSKRRTEAEIQKRLSSISSPKSPQLNVSNEKEIRDHFQICLKMYAENKISAKNAWNLKIIDYMRTVLHSQGLSNDSLQVASTSLDVSAKIYGIRVDDIHAEGLKLASNMARVNTQQDAADDGDPDQEDGEGDGDKENEGPKKKKKRKMFSGTKTTVVKDPKSLLGDVLKLESVFFQTRTNLEFSAIDNLFTNKLPMNHGRYKFMLLSKDKAWPSYDVKDSQIDYEQSYPFELKEIKNLQICAPFGDFEIDEWDPDQEAQLLKDDTNKPVLEEEVVYDAEGIPIPELDGSIHDLFANGGDNQYESSEEEEGNPLAHDAVITNKVAHIVDFRPKENGVRADDYSYSNAVNLLGNKLITQVWAGPSHWKLKHVRRIISRFSGVPEKQSEKTVKKTRIQPVLVDFYTEMPQFDRSKIFKAKRYRIDECPIKCTLPQVIHTDNNFYRSLMLKPVFISTNDNKKTANNGEDHEVGPYNYENPNDSLYCSQIGMDDGDHGAADDGDGDGDFHNDDENDMPQPNFLGGNLIDAPELVPKTYINYALQAKKMDMKKLKIAVWKSIVSEKPNELIPDDGMYKKGVSKKKFSEIYKELPVRITDKMRQDLSCPLAFVALLHLANEQNLHLTGLPDFGDFTIEQLTHFKPV